MRLTSTDSDRLELRQPFTVLRVFFGFMLTPIGLSMLVGSVWMLVAPANIIPEGAPGFLRTVGFGMDLSGAVMIFLVGLLFTVVGLVLFGLRCVVVIDRKAMEATIRWSLWTPLGRICAKKSTVGLGSARAVLALREEKHRSEGEKSWLFALAVKREDGTQIPLLEYASDQPCSLLTTDARRVARFLKIDLVDMRKDGELYRSSPEGEPLADRLARDGVASDLPDAPAGSRVRHSISDDEIAITIPPPRSMIQDIVLTALEIGLPPGLTFWLFHMLDAGLNEGLKFVFTAFAGLFSLGFLAMLRVQARMDSTTREHVLVTPERVHVKRSGFLVSGSFDSPVRDVLRAGIEPLTAEHRSPQVIMVESRSGAFHFGRHLSPEERNWLVSAIKKMLVQLPK